MTSSGGTLCRNGWNRIRILTKATETTAATHKTHSLYSGLLQAAALYLGYLALSLTDLWGYLPPMVQAVTYGLLFLLMIACIMSGFLGGSFLGGGFPGKRAWPLKASLRAAILSLLLFSIAGIMAGPDSGRLLEIAVKPRAVFSYPTPEITLTVTPPAYSGRQEYVEVLDVNAEQSGEIKAIPEGSSFKVRLNNISHAPRLIAGHQSVMFLAGEMGDFVAEITLKDETGWQIKEGSRRIGAWPINILEDEAPIIDRADFRQLMTDDGLFGLSLHLRDDYGLDRVTVGVVPPGVADDPYDRTTLAISELKEYSGELYVNLAASDFAGDQVDLVLEVIDQAGQSRKKVISGISLPQKKFANPHARKIIGIRGEILKQPDIRKKLARQIMALGLVQGDGQISPVYYMALRSAYWRLTNPVDVDDISSARDILWDLALTMEEGGQSISEILEALASLKLSLLKRVELATVKQQLQELDRRVVLFRRQEMSAVSPYPLRDSLRQKDKAENYNIKALRRIYSKIIAHSHYREFDQALDMVSYLEHGFIYPDRNIFSDRSYAHFQVIARARDKVDILEKTQRQVMSYVYRNSVEMEVAIVDLPEMAARSGLKLPSNKDIQNWIAIQKKLGETVNELGRSLLISGIDASRITVATSDLMADVVNSMEAGNLAATAQYQAEILNQLRQLKRLLDRKIKYNPEGL